MDQKTKNSQGYGEEGEYLRKGPSIQLILFYLKTKVGFQEY